MKMVNKMVKFFDKFFLEWVICFTLIEFILCFIFRNNALLFGLFYFICSIMIILSALTVLGGLLMRKWKQLEEFDECEWHMVDYQAFCLEESNSHFIRQIRMINYLYDQSGVIDEIFNKGELCKIFHRLVFLNGKLHFTRDIIQWVTGSLIFFILSGVISILNYGDYYIYVITYTLIFFCLIMCIFILKGTQHKAEECIWKYELDKLQEKLNKFCCDYQIDCNGASALELQQTAIIALKNNAKGRYKEEILQDIRKINELDLCQTDGSQIDTKPGESQSGAMSEDSTSEKKKGLCGDCAEFRAIMKKYNVDWGTVKD